MIEKATGKQPYVVGKPNPMMFRSAMNRIGAHSENTGMIGDRMDTDVQAGIEAGLHTVLVLTGISDQAEIDRYPFRRARSSRACTSSSVPSPSRSRCSEGPAARPVRLRRSQKRNVGGFSQRHSAARNRHSCVLRSRPTRPTAPAAQPVTSR